MREEKRWRKKRRENISEKKGKKMEGKVKEVGKGCEKRASKKGISVRGLISQGNSREKKKET